MKEPFTWLDQSMNDYFNTQPSAVKGEANDATAFNKRYLYTKLYSAFEFKLPKEWALNFFRFWLFHYGSIAAIYTNEYGWICSPYSITKLNMYYQPLGIEVTNKLLKKPKAGVIGVNAGIIRLMDDFFGLDDLVTKYAVQLAQIDRSLNVNFMNSNVTAFFEAETKKQAEEIKEAYGQATEGKPLVVVNADVMNNKLKNKTSGINTMFPSASSNYIGDKLLDARRAIVNQFLTEVGIRNANYAKKERLNSQEVNENNDETRAIVSIIEENLKESFQAINEISDLGLEVKLRYNYNDVMEV